MSEVTLLVEMVGIVKRFPGVLANDRIDFSVREGEVHALLGENGAGKSTLMNILTGLYRPDGGEIRLRGTPVSFGSPRDAIRHGIGMIHQHFMLVPNHTVAENVMLGLDGLGFLLQPAKIQARVSELSRRYGMQVDPNAKIWQLSVGEQQRVEVLKMLYRGAKLLIMDEPTAVLTPQEVEELFATLREMTQAGHTIVFISHKLDEVTAIADRITVLRRGRVEAVALPAAQVTKSELARLMVGREVLFRVEKQVGEAGSPVLEIESVSALDDKGLAALKEISLQVRQGEILGIAGVAGNGQRELAETICGLREISGGTIRVAGKDLANRSPRAALEQRVSYIPEDRVGVGSVPNMSVAENLALRNYREAPVGDGWMINRPAMRQQATRLVQEFDILTPSVETASRLLSGGNLQKLILAREISGSPRVVIAVHPTRGLDVGATEAVHHLLIREREQGAAVLLISEDLDEILALADRVAVIYEGRIMGSVAAAEAEIEELGLMMAGSHPQRVEA